MILQALNGYYDRLLAQDASKTPIMGYGLAPMHFTILLGPNGEVVDDQDLRTTTNNRVRALELLVPKDFEDRTSGDKAPRALWDNAEYVLGVSDNRERAARRFANFVARQEAVLQVAHGDPGADALLAFLRSWSFEAVHKLKYAGEIDEKSNVCFKLDGVRGYIHDRPRVAAAWRASLLASSDKKMNCLVTGASESPARIHPLIKNIAKAGQPTPKLVAFDKDSTAFDSFGRKQGDNAPVSERAAFAYSTALNGLLHPASDQKIRIGGVTTVYWAEADSTEAAMSAEVSAQLLFVPATPDAAAADASETDHLRRSVMDLIGNGRPLESPELHLDPGTRFYILGLAPNAARLSVRFWEMTTLGALGEAFYQHWADLRMEFKGGSGLPPSIPALALRTAPARRNAKGETKLSFDDVSPLLAGELTRAVLTKGRYPASLLSTLIMRIRTDGHTDRQRISLIKAILVRTMRLEGRLPKHLPEKEYLVRTDPNDSNTARRLGRLFAIIERAQVTALGGDINTTIKDKFLGAAAATPGQVFVGLLKNAQHHTKRLRNGHSDAKWIKDARHARSAGYGLEHDIGTLCSTFNDGFPQQHSIEEQGLFLVGYYQERFGGKADPSIGTEPGIDTSEDISTNTDDQE